MLLLQLFEYVTLWLARHSGGEDVLWEDWNLGHVVHQRLCEASLAHTHYTIQVILVSCQGYIGRINHCKHHVDMCWCRTTLCVLNLLGCHNIEVMLLHEMGKYLREALIDFICIEPAFEVPGYPFIAIATKQIHQLQDMLHQQLLQHEQHAPIELVS